MNEDPRELFQRLFSAGPPPDRPAEDVIDHIARLTDLSADLGRADGSRRAVELCERARAVTPLSDEQATLLLYFEANAWGTLSSPSPADPGEVWAWTDEAFVRQFQRLRQAQRSRGFATLDPLRRSQVHTNLGNALDSIGRFVEALECYERAVRACPPHGMARGNLGVCLSHYGVMQPHLPHQAGYCTTTAFLARSRSELKTALTLPLDAGAACTFAAYHRRVEGLLADAESADGFAAETAVPGRTARERRYRRWCLVRHLFLNPLNDLGAFPEAASDCLHLPGIVAEPDRGRYVLSLFNQIKQEYATSRFLLYEGLTARTPHFADRGVPLADMLDDAAHSLALEKTRIAFRTAYSLLDKIAFLLNAYLALGVRPQAVSFRKIWHEKEDPGRGLKPAFQGRQNWPLRGLFWLSRDLCVEGDERDALDPDAQDLVLIRNHLEHKHLTVHEGSWVASGRCRGGESPDGLFFAIDRRDFESRALRAVKLARSALIYLVHAVLAEETARAADGAPAEAIVPMVLNPIEDGSRR